MMTARPPIRIAIVGAGPRGLGAVEALVERLAGMDKVLEITIFDNLQLPGAGPNFDPAQTSNCILNIPTRAINIDPALELSCGDFSSWQKQLGFSDTDRFPTRAELGTYLMARFREVTQSGSGRLHLSAHKTKATTVKHSDQGWFLATQHNSFGPFDEVLLIQGQPQTRPDDQISRWANHASDSSVTLIDAYPDRQLLAAAEGWSGKQVGIRGLGLSTFDVLRVLTVGLGGSFQDGNYRTSGREPSRIHAFSLNGQPPFPKPVDQDYDGRFDPTRQETEQFEQALPEVVASPPDAALALLCELLATPTLRIGLEMGADFASNDVQAWLATECDASGEQETRDPVEALKHGIALAKGDVPPTVGYILGQVWRKWQNELRVGFNIAEKEPETAKALVGFDEGLKRYSYGPPLRSSIELLALIHCNLVSLNVVDDPTIKMVEDGWQLIEDDDLARVSIMVDAVLPSPALATVSDPLIVNLKNDNMMREVYENSGADTRPDGHLVGADGGTQLGLCMLGRLALGSVIAADSIHACFGAASVRWAEGVIERSEGDVQMVEHSHP